MFHIFNKKEDDFEVVAFVSGTCIKWEDVHDEVFSKKMKVFWMMRKLSI